MKLKIRSDGRFRKAFVPWYDTELIMLLTLIFAVQVLLFSMFGVAAVLDVPRFHPHLWFPCFLGGLSLALVISSMIRLLRRWSSAND